MSVFVRREWKSETKWSVSLFFFFLFFPPVYLTIVLFSFSLLTQLSLQQIRRLIVDCLRSQRKSAACHHAQTAKSGSRWRRGWKKNTTCHWSECGTGRRRGRDAFTRAGLVRAQAVGIRRYYDGRPTVPGSSPPSSIQPPTRFHLFRRLVDCPSLQSTIHSMTFSHF